MGNTGSQAGRHYRAAIIGHTGAGNYGHSLDICFNDLPGVEVVAIADPDPDGLAAGQRRSGATTAYRDYRQMLDKEQPDLVAIAPRFVHERVDMVTAATAHGCHIYLEKPIAATLAEADVILKTATDAGVKIAVAYQFQMHPATVRLRELVDEGKIGKLRLVRSYGKMDHRGGVQDLAVLGTHLFDMMRLFAGTARWCSADLFAGSRLVTADDVRSGDEGIGAVLGDGLRACFGFDHDVLGTFESYHHLGGGDTVFGFDLVGEQGQLAHRGSFTRRLYYSPHPYAEPGIPTDRWEKIDVPSAGLHEMVGDEPPDAAAHAALVHRANQRVVLDLLDAIENDREPATSVQRAHAAMEMIQAVSAAHAAGGRITLPLENRNPPYVDPGPND